MPDADTHRPTGIAFDLARARRETPGCESVLHFKNAGALIPRPVYDNSEAEVARFCAALASCA